MSNRISRRETRQGGLVAPVVAAVVSLGPAAAVAQTVDPGDTLVEGIHISYSAGAAALSSGVYSSAIRDNVIVVDHGTYEARFENSALGNVGIVQVNQDVGIASNQANMVSIAVAAGAGDVLPLASFYGQVAITGNTITVGNVTFTNVIQNIFDGTVGIAQLNQNTGIANTNVNALAIALGLGTSDGAVVMGDGHLSATNTGNTIVHTGPVQMNTVLTGVSNVTGIGQFNQTNGIGIVASNTMTISVNVMTLP